MTALPTHSKTGEKFAEMSDETLLKIVRRVYKFAADTSADQRFAQTELRARREARS